jgi:RES domain-containing protein
MRLWRIAAETRKYAAADLGGAGAAKEPGRWNDYGEPVIYCAPTIAMAVLETGAHVDDAGLPLDRYLVQIDVPTTVWEQRETLAVGKLPIGWDAIPGGRASVEVGSKWLSSLRTAILLVPSVIVPEERNALVNPRHPDAATISAKVLRRFEYNQLFR